MVYISEIEINSCEEKKNINLKSLSITTMLIGLVSFKHMNTKHGIDKKCYRFVFNISVKLKQIVSSFHVGFASNVLINTLEAKLWLLLF